MYLTMVRWLALWVCLCTTMGGAVAATVIIVAADRGEAYSEAAEAVAEQLRRTGLPSGEVLRLLTSELDGTDMVGRAQPKMFVTLGAASLSKVLSKTPRAAVIAGLIPRTSYERVLREVGKSTAVVSAVYLDQPFGRQLDLIRVAIPDVRRVGVLWGAESEPQRPALQATMAARGLELKSETMVAGGLFSGLKDLLGNVDLLLAVADPQVFNATTLPNILLATYRARIPVMAFSPAYVKAGALLSLYSTPAQVGAQTGALARAVLQGGGVPPPQYAHEFTILVNDYVARSLGLQLDATILAEQLLRIEKRP